MHGLVVLWDVSLVADRLWGCCWPLALAHLPVATPHPMADDSSPPSLLQEWAPRAHGCGGPLLVHLGMNIATNTSEYPKVVSAIALQTSHHGKRSVSGTTTGSCDSHRWEMLCKDQGRTSTLMGFWLRGTGVLACQGWMLGFLYPTHGACSQACYGCT